ncbi:LIM domain-containing protein, partial [Pleomorphochaeta sp. DL1XJH-081]|uniref:LIM domain-containing protein n=1 Tax=Pleomorphochaeta sp. DL1XJH-081 TaxID=3409690 RepID=UPI003BB6709F
MNAESPPPSPPPHGNGSIFAPFPFLDPSRFRKCAGCNRQIGLGRNLSCMGGVWHPECFRCRACDQ